MAEPNEAPAPTVGEQMPDPAANILDEIANYDPPRFTPKLAAALAMSQADVQAAGKSGKNHYDKYTYATLEDFCKVIRDPMAKTGLALAVDIANVMPLSPRPTRSGGQEYGVLVTLVGVLVHESGESATFTGYGMGYDRSDKAIYKAITGGKKYLIANIFNVPTTDDPEHDERKPEGEPARNAKPAEQPTPRKPRQSRKPKNPPKEDVGPQFIEGSLNAKYQTANGLLNVKQIAELKDAVVKAKLDPAVFLFWVNKHFNDGNAPVENSYNIKAEWYGAILMFVKDKPEAITGAADVKDDAVTGADEPGISKLQATNLQAAFKAGKIKVPDDAEIWLTDYLAAQNPPVTYVGLFSIPKRCYDEILEVVKDHPDSVIEHLEYKKHLAQKG